MTAGGPENPLEGAVQRARVALQQVDPAPFSPSAFELLKAKIAGYLTDLVTESMKVAKRNRADTVSATHVERASEYLVSSSGRRFFRHLGTVGGIMLGAALGNFLSMTNAGQYPQLGTLLSAGLGIVGAFCIAFHIAND